MTLCLKAIVARQNIKITMATNDYYLTIWSIEICMKPTFSRLAYDKYRHSIKPHPYIVCHLRLHADFSSKKFSLDL